MTSEAKSTVKALKQGETALKETAQVGGEEALKSRTGDPAVESIEEDRRRLRSKIGELTMENELLRDTIHRTEAGHPPAWRRSSR